MSCYKRGDERVCPQCGVKRIRERNSKVCSPCHLGYSGEANEHGQETALGQDTKSEPAHNTIPESDDLTRPLTFEEKYHRYCAYIGKTSTSCVPPPAFEGEEHTIIHITDCHVPFCNMDALREIVAETRGSGTCVVGGDFFNAGAFSRFIDPVDKISPREELQQAQIVLQFISENYPRVIIRKGNHPDRIRKYFGSRIPPEMMFLVTTDLLPLIANGLPNVEVAQPLLPQFPSSHWVTMVGDCAFTHGESHSKIQMRPVSNVEDWLRRWGSMLPVTPRVICQEHNHAAGMMPTRDQSTLLIQTPALSNDMDYQWDGRLAYNPNVTGYTRIVQRDGVTDWNASGFVLWGTDKQRTA